jgi:GNAT superfamily N-acetyltransferase
VSTARRKIQAVRDDDGRLTPDPATLANAHWLAAILAFVADMGGRARQYGAVHAYLGGVPVPFANGCLILNPAKPSDVRRAVAWLMKADVPYRVRIDAARAPRAVDECIALGLERATDRMPGMVMEPVPAPPEPSAGVTVHRVDEGTYAGFLELVVATGFPAEWARASFPSSLVRDPDNAMFVGRLDGRPAATSLAVRTGDVTGVYAVGTLDDARRRGLGTAVTWACVDAARGWGSEAVVLQASEMGYPIYRSMGFESVVEYERFGPAGALPEDA